MLWPISSRVHIKLDWKYLVHLIQSTGTCWPYFGSNKQFYFFTRYSQFTPYSDFRVLRLMKGLSWALHCFCGIQHDNCECVDSMLPYLSCIFYPSAIKVWVDMLLWANVDLISHWLANVYIFSCVLMHFCAFVFLLRFAHLHHKNTHVSIIVIGISTCQRCSSLNSVSL